MGDAASGYGAFGACVGISALGLLLVLICRPHVRAALQKKLGIKVRLTLTLSPTPYP